MAKSKVPGRRKSSNPVEVLVFPKHERGRSRSLDATAVDTQTDVRAISLHPPEAGPNEAETEAFAIPKHLFDDTDPTEIQERTPPPARPSSRGVPRPSGSASKSKGRISSGKKRAPASGAERGTERPRRSTSQARALSPAVVAEMCLKGHALFEAGKLEDARRVFEAVVAGGSNDAFPHTMLGTLYLALGDHGRALALFEAALALEPDDLAARVYRGEIQLARGRIKLAVEDLRAAQKLGPRTDPFVERAAKLLALAAAVHRS